MNIVMLSGGSGKRLWPLSNDIRSKQFLKIFKTATGEYESMVQRVYRQIRSVDKQARITMTTFKSQVPAIYNHLGDQVDICVEPCRRDTFPAIALACAHLKSHNGVGDDDVVVVCPVDPYVDADYFKALRAMSEHAEHGEANLVVMGIAPTYPSEKYGYVIPEGQSPFSCVSVFREKPNQAAARQYIAQGALWNGGVFAFKLRYVLGKARELLRFSDYADIISHYESFEKISFDYAVVEKEAHIEVMRFDGQWKDLGTWNTLTEAMDENCIGKAIVDDSCQNVHVINELNIPVLCMGLKDTIVSASPDGILVSDKAGSSLIKPHVERIVQRLMFAEKSWGLFQIIDIGENNLTIKVTLNPRRSMNYHSHRYREEIWTVVRGEGIVVLDGEKQRILPGDVIKIPSGCKHTVTAVTELQMIEVQLGGDVDVHDKEKHDWPL